MSFILDALRKSEAARRRSETPDLFATLPQAPAPTRSRAAWPLWAMAGFGAVSSAIALWLLLQRPDVPAAPADVGARSAIDAVPPDAQTDAGADADRGADSADAMPAAADASVATPPAPSTTTPAAPAPTVAPATLPAPAPAFASPARAAIPPTPPAPTVASPAPSPAPPPANGDRATALADLAPDVRRQLPALKLSMQVWNDDPQRRFVILDGQRLREGDTAGEVVVERITRTEVLLSWRGARLRLPAE
ncbi:MAG: general secretion pathway protein GspB [Lysobacteraceae bacterium]